MNSVIQSFLFLATFFSLSLLADTVELKNGKTIRGNLTGRQAIYVTLVINEGQSEIERRLKPDEIAHIHFSDSASKQEALDRYSTSDPYQATSLLEKLVRRRLPYMDLLSHSDEALFAMLLESYIHSGRANDALDRAKLWRTKLKSSDAVDKLDELQIVAAKSADNLDEAAFYSKRWVDAGKGAHETALPWSVLAEKSLNEGYIEDALWLALNSIVFTYPDKPRFLENAYEIAIFSAFHMDDREYASKLYDDMRRRNLPWPIDSKRTHIIAQLKNSKTAVNTEVSELSPTSGRRSSHSTVLRKIAGSP